MKIEIGYDELKSVDKAAIELVGNVHGNIEISNDKQHIVVMPSHYREAVIALNVLKHHVKKVD